MAKHKPIFTLAEMERKLGYSDTNSSNYADKNTKRFYSDLTLVPASVYERTKKEFEEHEKQQTVRKGDETDLEKLTWPLTIGYGQDRVTFTQTTHVGFYTFAVDIHFGFGLDLPLLFTKNEALTALIVPKAGCFGGNFSEMMS